jgi:ribonucleoside-diphosphate reductase alpha chain
MTGGARRAAHIALLAVDHPDVEDFITCKQGDKNRALTQFNISVKITNKFIDAVEKDLDWDLVFDGKKYKTVKAKYLYDLMVKNAYTNNEPGMFNVDTINFYNNGWWIFEIHECNPCGEISMEKYSSCNLASLNLTTYILEAFTPKASFDFDLFKKDAAMGIRFLDDVLDAADYPLPKIAERMMQTRRIGLGITGLGDAFAMMGMKYGSEESKKLTKKIATVFRNASYETSVGLAAEKGMFTVCDKEKILQSNFVKKLPEAIQEGIKQYGLRNIACNAIAPTGTISLTFGQNCSSGIEPIFSFEYNRRVRTKNDPDVYTEQKVMDYAWRLWTEQNSHSKEAIINALKEEPKPKDVSAQAWEPRRDLTDVVKHPEFFVTTKDVSAKDSIDIQAIFQEYIDQSISKTLNLAPGTTFEEYKDLFMYAYKKGLKGFTTFNPEGSMKGILEYNEPVETKDSDYVVRRNAPKRPDELECDIHQVTVKGQKIVVLVGKHKGSLYEIFADDDQSNKIDIKYDKGIIRKISRGRYDLIVKNGEEKLIVENLSKNFGGTYGVLARLVSMSLRHGTPLQFVVDQLGKSNEFVGFEKSVSRVLKKYIKDGEKVMTGEVCPECGNELQFKEGCVSCPNCSWSRCL